jgi:hypothetical protein
MNREMTTLTFPETSRCYTFEHDHITFYNVIKIGVSESGTHYLETHDGLKHIVAPKWLTITIDTFDWSF